MGRRTWDFLTSSFCVWNPTLSPTPESSRNSLHYHFVGFFPPHGTFLLLKSKSLMQREIKRGITSPFENGQKGNGHCDFVMWNWHKYISTLEDDWQQPGLMAGGIQAGSWEALRKGGGRKNRRKAEHEEVGAGIALGGLVSRGEMQTRQTEGLAATSTWNCNFRTESLFARDEIIKTGLN